MLHLCSVADDLTEQPREEWVCHDALGCLGLNLAVGCALAAVRQMEQERASRKASDAYAEGYGAGQRAALRYLAPVIGASESGHGDG